jgi:hypothetical protein
MNNKNIVLIIVVIVIIALGLWYFMSMQGTPASDMSAATSTPTATTGTSATPATPARPAVGQTVPPAGSNAGKPFTAQVTITGFTGVTETNFPLVNYKVESGSTGTGFFSLIGQNTNTVVWGKDQPIAGNYTLDPNQITIPDNGPSHKLLPGDYFIRIQDSTGATVGESKPFRIAAGQVTNN